MPSSSIPESHKALPWSLYQQVYSDFRHQVTVFHSPAITKHLPHARRWGQRCPQPPGVDAPAGRWAEMNQEHEWGNGKSQAVEAQSCAPDVSGTVGAFRRRTRSGQGRRAGWPPGAKLQPTPPPSGLGSQRSTSPCAADGPGPNSTYHTFSGQRMGMLASPRRPRDLECPLLCLRLPPAPRP